MGTSYRCSNRMRLGPRLGRAILAGIGVGRGDVMLNRQPRRHGEGDRPKLGAITMIAALAFLPAMDAIAKLLSGHLPIVEIVWARYLFYALAVIPLAYWRHGRAVVRPARPALQLLRATLLAMSALMFFSAIARMPLADAMAVFFIYPILILLASNLLLRETIGCARWAIVALGFTGAAMAAKPSFIGISPGIPYALASSCAYAGALLVTRRLAPYDPPLVTAAISAIFGVLAYSFAMPFVWIPPAPRDWPLMAVMGGIAAIGHFLIVVAHRMTSASRLAPYGYTEIVAAVFFGFVIFRDWPTSLVWIGIVLIVASGIAASLREGRSTQTGYVPRPASTE
jgi:drug/metabolite transporter (DMT)-like permease